MSDQPPAEQISWVGAACFTVFLPMIVNLVVLGLYLLGA